MVFKGQGSKVIDLWPCTQWPLTLHSITFLYLPLPPPFVHYSPVFSSVVSSTEFYKVFKPSIKLISSFSFVWHAVSREFLYGETKTLWYRLSVGLSLLHLNSFLSCSTVNVNIILWTVWFKKFFFIQVFFIEI